MFDEYVTVEGDMVDLIAYRRFGAESPMTEAILEANPGLASAGAFIPVGTVVRIPAIEVKDRKNTRGLWQ